MKSTRTGWGFLSPTLIILVITGFLPFLYVLYVGFFDWNVFAAETGLRFAGANNYRRLVFDIDFLKSLWRTLGFTLCGLWRVPLVRFSAAMVGGGVIWIAFVFVLINAMGMSEFIRESQWKWALMAVALALLMFNNLWVSKMVSNEVSRETAG